MSDFDGSGDRYTVVVSDEGRIGLWPERRPVPQGWAGTGFRGSREECAAEVDRMGFPPREPAAPGDSLATLVDAAVRRHGHRAAVGDKLRSLTYQALGVETDRVAAWLRRQGVSQGDRVAAYRPRGVSTITTLLGILKAGAAYVAIDTRYPDARRDLMITASRSTMVVTEPGWAGRLAHLPIPAVELRNEALPAGEDAVPERVPVGPADAACVLFTSGSSGAPKAIVLEHRNLLYFATNPALPRMTAQDRVAQVSSISFDAFHFELWAGLAAGAELVTLPAIAELIAADLERELQRARVTVMLAPTMAVNHVVFEDRDAFAPLRLLCTGGDVLQPTAARETMSGAFAGEFHNLYGPAEATTACTGYRVGELPDAADNVPIGRPLAGAEVYVLDAYLEVVGPGEVGEIHIGGQGVAREYLGQPGLTAERFLPDPFGRPGTAMYATGDLARRRADGVLEFVGRKDDQVKIRGYRVEPREVERLLSRHPSVCEAAVLPMGAPRDRCLVALVVTRDRLPPRALREFAVAELPDYMVPAAIVSVPEIPGNEHGKRDLPALIETARVHMRRRERHVPPRDDTQAYLAGLWEDLLAVEHVGITDDFFALGGNSLLAFRAQRRIKRDLGIEIDVQELLRTGELAALAARLNGAVGEVRDAAVAVDH